MDVDEVMLDWSGNEEAEGTQQRPLETLAPVDQAPISTKDQATLSGAESLLALASGGVAQDAQDDKDSDVVSLGGGDDDMQELYAYQSRTHLGGTPGETIPGAQSTPVAETTQGLKRADTPPTSAAFSHISSQNSKFPHNSAAENPRPNPKPNSQTKSQSSDPTRSPSFTRLVPPTGPLALPPKPITMPPASSLRPSHPSIMSASSMAPIRERERDLQRESRDSLKGKSGTQSHVSPDPEDLALAPGWEIRRSRDSQEIYYYHTKTYQSTWHRSIATGLVSAKVESTETYSSTGYTRGRGRDHTQASDRRSPVDREISQSRGTDLASQPRGRQSRFDQVKPEPNERPGSSSLSFDERHYRPDENRSTPPEESAKFRSRHAPGSGASSFRREPSPSSIPARPPLPHNDSDRDRPVPRRDQDRERISNERIPHPHSNGKSLNRHGESNTERERSRSPGRGRISHGSWSNDAAMGRDAPRSPPRDRLAPVGMDVPRSYDDSPPPPRRGAVQGMRRGSPGFEGPRYLQSNHDQSSSRDRHRTPPERPRKRTRSVSPSFNNAARAPASRFGAQPPRAREEPNLRQREGYYQPSPFDSRDQQRPSHPPQESSTSSGIRPRQSFRHESGDGNRFSSKGEDDENDMKRRKIYDSSDSTRPLRRFPPDGYDDRHAADNDRNNKRPPRPPLPPQAERFNAASASPPPPPSPPLRNPHNGALPASIPSGPRRGTLMRDSGGNFPQSSRPPPSHRDSFGEPRILSATEARGRFGDANNPSDSMYDDKDVDRGKPRGRERARDSYADLPTGPRAMELDVDASARSARSPPRHHRFDRSPPPRRGPGGSGRWDEAADPSAPRRSFGDSHWARRDRDGENHENDRSQLQRDTFPPNSRFGPQPPPQRPIFNAPPYRSNTAPRRPSYPHTSHGESYAYQGSEHHSSRGVVPASGQHFSGEDRQNRRLPTANSLQDTLRPLAPPEIQRRRSFSSIHPPNVERNSHQADLPQAPRASLSPDNRINPLPIGARPPPPRPFSSIDSPNVPEKRPIPEEDAQIAWRKEESGRRSPSVSARGADFVEDGHADASPLLSRANTAVDDAHEGQGDRAGSSKPVEVSRTRPDHDETQEEGPALPPPSAEGRAEESQPSVSDHVEQSRRGPVLPRTRRFSKPIASTSENGGGPSIHEQVQAPFRSGSLLERLSNPVPAPRIMPAPNLRERISSLGPNWKTGPLPNSDGPPSLRDRVQPINDARRAGWAADNEWTNPGFDEGAGEWGTRRGGKPRKRGRGQ